MSYVFPVKSKSKSRSKQTEVKALFNRIDTLCMRISIVYLMLTEIHLFLYTSFHFKI